MFPVLVVASVKVTVSRVAVGPAASVRAGVDRRRHRRVSAPAASVPPAADKVTHVCAFDAVQAIEAVPVFVTV